MSKKATAQQRGIGDAEMEKEFFNKMFVA